jgi:TolB protein
MNADGSGQRRLTHNLSSDYARAWSPDGRKIAFASGECCGNGNSRSDVYVVNADGSGQVNLTP